MDLSPNLVLALTTVITDQDFTAPVDTPTPNSICRQTDAEPLSVDEHLLIFALLLGGSTRLLLGVWVVGQLRGTGGHGTGQDELLQVVEDHAVLLGQEGDGCTLLARSSCTPDAMGVVCEEQKHERISSSKVWTNDRSESCERQVKHQFHVHNVNIRYIYMLIAWVKTQEN